MLNSIWFIFGKSILWKKNLRREKSIDKKRKILLGKRKIQSHRIDKIVSIAGRLQCSMRCLYNIGAFVRMWRKLNQDKLLSNFCTTPKPYPRGENSTLLCVSIFFVKIGKFCSFLKGNYNHYNYHYNYSVPSPCNFNMDCFEPQWLWET